MTGKKVDSKRKYILYAGWLERWCRTNSNFRATVSHAQRIHSYILMNVHTYRQIFAWWLCGACLSSENFAFNFRAQRKRCDVVPTEECVIVWFRLYVGTSHSLRKQRWGGRTWSVSRRKKRQQKCGLCIIRYTYIYERARDYRFKEFFGPDLRIAISRTRIHTYKYILLVNTLRTSIPV